MQYYKNFGGQWDLNDRWNDIKKLHEDIGLFKQTDTVLDIGCAEGLISFNIAELTDSVLGIDTEQKRIDIACYQKRIKNINNVNFNNNVNFKRISITKFDIKPRRYDIILCLGVLQHMPFGLINETLKKLFTGCRRLILFRFPMTNNIFLNQLLKIDSKYTIDVLSKGNKDIGGLILATRND